MTKDSFEYQKMKADYEAKQKYKHDIPDGCGERGRNQVLSAIWERSERMAKSR